MEIKYTYLLLNYYNY